MKKNKERNSERSVQYYQENKGRFQKLGWYQYKELSEEKKQYSRYWYWNLSDKDRQKLREYSKKKYYSMSEVDRQKNERIYERIHEGI